MKFFQIFTTLLLLCAAVCKFAKSALFFPSNSAYGIFAAIAVPLDLPHRNVFVSYNFEANYNLPQTWGIPPYAAGVEDEDLFEDTARLNNDKSRNNSTMPLSIAENLETPGVDNADYTDITTVTPFGNDTDTSSKRKKRRKREVNSLLTRKHFYHILIDKFKSPTTSRDENLPLPYYQAEIDGIHDQCHYYEKLCPESVLDLISTPLYKIIELMESNIKKFGK